MRLLRHAKNELRRSQGDTLDDPVLIVNPQEEKLMRADYDSEARMPSR